MNKGIDLHNMFLSIGNMFPLFLRGCLALCKLSKINPRCFFQLVSRRLYSQTAVHPQTAHSLLIESLIHIAHKNDRWWLKPVSIWSTGFLTRDSAENLQTQVTHGPDLVLFILSVVGLFLWLFLVILHMNRKYLKNMKGHVSPRFFGSGKTLTRTSGKAGWTLCCTSKVWLFESRGVSLTGIFVISIWDLVTVFLCWWHRWGLPRHIRKQPGPNQPHRPHHLFMIFLSHHLCDV